MNPYPPHLRGGGAYLSRGGYIITLTPVPEDDPSNDGFYCYRGHPGNYFYGSYPQGHKVIPLGEDHSFDLIQEVELNNLVVLSPFWQVVFVVCMLVLFSAPVWLDVVVPGFNQ